MSLEYSLVVRQPSTRLERDTGRNPSLPNSRGGRWAAGEGGFRRQSDYRAKPWSAAPAQFAAAKETLIYGVSRAGQDAPLSSIAISGRKRRFSETAFSKAVLKNARDGFVQRFPK